MERRGEEEERKMTGVMEEERKMTGVMEEERKMTGAMEEERKMTGAMEEEEEEEERKMTGAMEEEEERKMTGAMEEEEERKMTGAMEEEGKREGVADEDAAGLKAKRRGTSCPDRKCLPGILYLGHIPPRFRPKHLRNLLSPYGEIGRIFLQPEDGQVRRRKRKSGLRRCDFTEGWVEFRDKRVAKRVAASLHNTPMGNRKRFSSDLWAMKYLHRFQWTHLSERLSYEQSVLQQRLRVEVSQAKKETNFYLNNLERSAHLRRRGQQEKTWDFTQRQTEDEIQEKKKKTNEKKEKKKNEKKEEKNEKKEEKNEKKEKERRLLQQSRSNVSLLAKIFNSNTADS